MPKCSSADGGYSGDAGGGNWSHAPKTAGIKPPWEANPCDEKRVSVRFGGWDQVPEKGLIDLESAEGDGSRKEG